VKSKVAHYRQARQLDNLDPVKYTKNEVVFTFSSFRFPEHKSAHLKLSSSYAIRPLGG